MECNRKHFSLENETIEVSKAAVQPPEAGCSSQCVSTGPGVTVST